MAKKKSDNKVGRPLKFGTVEELDSKIDDFIEYCEERELPLTFERLAVFLECDRKTIYNYADKDEFFHSIKRVRDRILADLMDKGLSGQINSAFGIFCLKNYGYADKQEIEQTVRNIDNFFEEEEE